MKIRSKALLAILAAGTLALGACGGGNGGSGGSASGDAPAVAENPTFEAGTTMAKLSEQGSIKIGTKFDQPLFGLKGLDNNPEGFDVEVGKIIAGQLGIPEDKITWVETPSRAREQAIQNGDVDMVVATYTINDTRKQSISFAGPYYVAGQAILVKSDNDTVTGPDALKANPDAKVCSVAGSTPAENIKQYLANEGQLVTFDVYEKCISALDTNQVQAVTTDNVILLGYMSANEGKYKLAGDTFTEEPYGIGIPKGDVAFCEFINTTLADNKDAYDAAWKSTAGTVEGAETPELPAADACS